MQAEGLVVLGHIQWQLLPHPHQASMSQVLNLAAESSHNLNHFWPCRIHDRMLAFNATGNALTTVLAGFARMIVSLPNMILLVALVAVFLRVLILARPGIVNTPVFFTSAAPISPNEPKSLVTTLFFSSALVSPFTFHQECQMYWQAAFTAWHVAAKDGVAWLFLRRLNSSLLRAIQL